MLEHERENPDDRVVTSGGPSTTSSTSSNDHADVSETLGDHDHYQHHNPLHDILEEGVSTKLHRIATAVSRHKSHATAPRPDSSESDSALNPESADFDVTKWVRNFVGELNEQGHKSSELGVLFADLDVFGSGSALQLQERVDSVLLAPLRIGELFSHKKQHKQILHGFNGVLKSGELLAVLGRPGSGCSTFLKSICGELHDLTLGKKTNIHYNGASQHQMKKEFKGEVIYNQEVDKHFPHLTVGQTLEFAASMRTPSNRIHGMSRIEFCRYIAAVVMAVFGLSHTYNTKVGNDFIRGVSGGERKRVSIAEMVVAGSPICAWDNSTRGLDSTSALKFVLALRLSSDIGKHAHAVAMYQASQAIYDVFDKVTVLYDGRQIYFGPAHTAKAFFEHQGWFCPPRQTTGDFLTSVTNPHERTPRPGMEQKVPRTPEEFERYWLSSPEFKALQDDMARYDAEFEGERQTQSIAQLREKKHYRQSKHVRPGSPFTISILMQVRQNTKRAYQRIWNDLAATGSRVVVQLIMALIIGSIFYGTPDATAGFNAKGSVLFMAILLNALTAISEINGLYVQRPIVEKHASYAFYHPATEAAAGIMADIPVKFVTAVVFSLIVYFLAGLRREPGQFFLFLLITYVSTFVMTALFRFLAGITKTVSQAMALAGVLVLAIVQLWLYHSRPRDASMVRLDQMAQPNLLRLRDLVANDYSHVWRNFGILMGFLVALMIIYFAAVEINSSTTSTAEALVFPRGSVPAHLDPKNKGNDEEAAGVTAEAKTEKAPKTANIEAQKDLFTWNDVVYDIDVKEGKRRLLDNVSGWVKPGTLTALMGASGAGKTTLLDVLAQRTSVGVVTGDMLVNGRPFGPTFQRQTGYVQQQDLHLDTATVRESLQFSAMLRRPKSVSKKEKYEFVEEVIKMLGMEEYANAVVGIPGEGLNVEQRKLLTIGVELVAKPKLLLFLDEPTSGLDSQSAWSICVFLRKLADAGQAVLCTIHQPNAILFQQFDRLLFLAKGGKTVYFGNIGENSRHLLDYFERNGSRHCGDDENPAEFMLEVVAEGVNRDGEDWHSVWKGSQEFRDVKAEIQRITDLGQADKLQTGGGEEGDSHSEFAMPFPTQVWAVTERIFQQYWRMPTYVFSKLLLGILAGLFIGFTFFKPGPTLAGMRDVLYAVFMVTTLFTTLVQQIQPLFITQRSLYEVRERPSKAYSWKAFLIANIIVEIPYQILTGILTFACFYYPVVGVQASVRQGLVLLFIIQLFIYASAFAHMTIAALHDAEAASALVVLLTMMSIVFSGVLQTKTALPGFWIFMYYVSPFTYWIGGITSTMLHGRPVVCSEDETLIFNPPPNMTCGTYLAAGQAPGTLQNPSAVEACRYCPISVADQFLASVNIFWSQRWRNFGIMWAYVVFDIAVAIGVYYVFRVKKGNAFQGLFTRLKRAKKN
ncbi:hypothetical protein NEMBOFW57_004040 [Staphylotrichum longicolle]|uniref:ABC transporter domain-containing protein n=1 Tax=Staphylotrichum longicolle TaxID=669026 RepID=A0AAD4F772_9PEZI|nr:hypothetical protein NEMBOFW57_004040 [Staphylotrichum longicolle]